MESRGGREINILKRLKEDRTTCIGLIESYISKEEIKLLIFMDYANGNALGKIDRELKEVETY